MNKNTLIMLPVSALILFIFFTYWYMANISGPNIEKYEKKHITGRISFITPRVRNSLDIRINDTLFYLRLPGDSYEYLSVGDSIDKEPNSQNLIIYKENKNFIIKIRWNYVQEYGGTQVRKTVTLINK